MGHPIYVIGERPRDGYFYVCNDLIRAGARELGSDGLAVMLYLLSHAGGSGKPYTTSPARISDEFGWSQNRERVTRALANCEKDNRLIVRRFIRGDCELQKRRAYVVAAGGRQFTDAQLSEHNRPIVLPSKTDRKSAI